MFSLEKMGCINNSILKNENKNAEDVLENFRVDCVIRNYQPKTTKKYVASVRIYIEMSDISKFNLDSEYQDFKPSLLKYLKYCYDKELDYETVSKYFTSLSAFFWFLVDEGKIKMNPVPAFRKRYLRTYKKTKRERQIITTEQLEEIIRRADHPLWKTVFIVLAKCGLRREELCNLDIGDINFREGIIYVKEHPKRTNCRVPFDKQVSDYIKRYWMLRKN